MNSNHLEDMSTEEQRRVNSAVQARIEAMFASVEAESGTPGECAAAILPVNTSITFFPTFFRTLCVIEHLRNFSVALEHHFFHLKRSSNFVFYIGNPGSR